MTEAPALAKWYCRCGQANPPTYPNCVNCNAPSSEGADAPFKLDEVLASGRPVVALGNMLAGLNVKKLVERESLQRKKSWPSL